MSPPADVYAFGILIWEVVTGDWVATARGVRLHILLCFGNMLRPAAGDDALCLIHGMAFERPPRPRRPPPQAAARSTGCTMLR